MHAELIFPLCIPAGLVRTVEWRLERGGLLCLCSVVFVYVYKHINILIVFEMFMSHPSYRNLLVPAVVFPLSVFFVCNIQNIVYLCI